MIAPAQRGPRDLMRTRLRLVQKSVSTQNSIDRLLEKFNVTTVTALDELYALHAACHAAQIHLAEQITTLEYPGHFLVKRVTNAGTFRFKHRLLFIRNALKQHHIGLEEIDDGIWSIYFNRVLLARLDERDYVIRD